MLRQAAYHHRGSRIAPGTLKAVTIYARSVNRPPLVQQSTTCVSNNQSDKAEWDNSRHPPLCRRLIVLNFLNDYAPLRSTVLFCLGVLPLVLWGLDLGLIGLMVLCDAVLLTTYLSNHSPRELLLLITWLLLNHRPFTHTTWPRSPSNRSCAELQHPLQSAFGKQRNGRLFKRSVRPRFPSPLKYGTVYIALLL